MILDALALSVVPVEQRNGCVLLVAFAHVIDSVGCVGTGAGDCWNTEHNKSSNRVGTSAGVLKQISHVTQMHQMEYTMLCTCSMRMGG